MSAVKSFIPTHVEFVFEKNNLYRTIHVDGAFGGPTPPFGLIHMSIYSEHLPLPSSITHQVTGGMMGEEISRSPPASSVEGARVVREVEANLVMSVDTARALRTWLDAKIQEVQEIRDTATAFAASKGAVKQ